MKLVKEFVETILKNGQLDKLGSFFNGDNYIQHNPGIGDGLYGLGKALGELAKQGITMKYDKIHMVLGQGNFVLVVSEGSFGGQPTSYYDLFRVQNGKIAERWDVMETLLPDDQRKNQSGKFSVADQDMRAINQIIQQYAIKNNFYDFPATFRADGSHIATHGRESQIFSKTVAGWKLVHVHYSNMPVTGERQGF